MRPTQALVGRDVERAFVVNALGRTSGRAAVIGGHAGVGKSHLAGHVADAWPGGATWISGRTGSATLPGSAVLRLLPVTGEADGLPPAALVAGAVATCTGDPDRLVVVDDAHLLDDLSALVIQQLVLDGTVPVVMTVRNGEAVPEVVRRLWEDGRVERVDLLPLGAAEVGALASVLVGGDVDELTVADLYRASQGNPLLLRQLVGDATDVGALRAEGGRWRWDGSVGRGLRLTEVLQARIAELGPGGSMLVTALAVAEPLGVAVLAEVAPGADLVAAERRGIVVVVHDGLRREARLGHPLVGEVVLAHGAPAELARVRRSLADALERRGGRRRDDLLRVARLRLDAGDAIAPGLLRRAARRAIELGADEFGLELARRAHESDPDAVAGRLLLGQALTVGRRDREAVAVLEGLIDDVTDDDDLVWIAFTLQQAHRLAGRPDAARAVLDRVQARVGDPHAADVVRCAVLQQLVFEGHSGEALRRADAMDLDDRDPRIGLRLLGSVAVGKALAGRTGEALAMVERLLPEALQRQDEIPLAPAWAVNAQGVALMMACRFEDALGFVELVRSIIAAQHVSAVMSHTPMLDVFAGRVRLAIGDVATARTHLVAAAGALGEDDVAGLAAWCRSLLAEACALLGETDRAVRLAAEAESTPSTMHLYDGDARRARAWVSALSGSAGRAEHEMLAAADAQAAEGQLAMEAFTLHHAVRLGAGWRVRTRLARVCEQIDSEVASAYRDHALALNGGTTDQLLAAAEALAAAGLRLEPAEVFSAAAVALDREGRRSAAAAAARRAQDLLEGCGTVATPGFHARASRAGLTRREAEIARLAAAGLTNREIADRLVVSVRTVEGHIYRASTKLGARDRSELAELLGAARDA